MKDTYIAFLPTGAKILVNPSSGDLEKIPSETVVLKNPTRVNLAGVPPELWVPDVRRNEVRPPHRVVLRQTAQSVVKPQSKLSWAYIQHLAITVIVIEVIHFIIVRYVK